jgi:excinuclease ABC subunit A
VESCSEGTFDQILKSTSLTAKYLNWGFRNFSSKKNIQNFIEIKGANNTKIDVTFRDVLTFKVFRKWEKYQENIISCNAKKTRDNAGEKSRQFSDRLFFSQIKHIEYVDQNPYR